MQVGLFREGRAINPTPLDDAPRAFIMGPRYKTLVQLMNGKKLTDLIGKG